MSFGFAFLVFVFASGICVLLVSLVRAPLGFEDQDGFHAVRPIAVTERSQPAAHEASTSLRELTSQA
jgi:hypothetical protein